MSSALRYIPVFEIEVIALDVSFEVRVNDQPVLRMPVGRVQTTFDVNPCIEDGPNTLSLLVKPRRRGRDFSEHASCKVALRRRPHPESDAAEAIGTLVFSGYGTQAVTGFAESTPAQGGGPVEVERLGTRGTLGFIVERAFGPWGWHDAEELQPTEALRASLLAEYHRVHALLARKDGAALSARCALQAADYQKAYSLPSLAEAHQLLGIGQIVSDPSVLVKPFPESILTLEILGKGRLVHLVDDEGKSPLELGASDVPEMSGRFNCVFCKTPSGFQIAR